MRDDAKLLSCVASVRERAETLQSSVTEHFPPGSEIALDLAALITKYTSVEADIQARDAKLFRLWLSPSELYAINEGISTQLGECCTFTNSLPHFLSSRDGESARPVMKAER